METGICLKKWKTKKQILFCGGYVMYMLHAAFVKGRCFWGIRFKSSSDVTLLRTFCKSINFKSPGPGCSKGG